MDKLIGDRVQVEISAKTQDVLRMYVIDDSQLEPLMQHQNYAERRIQTVKTHTNRILDHTGAPLTLWLQCLLYICFLLNYTADVAHNYQTPMWALTGTTSDISPPAPVSLL